METLGGILALASVVLFLLALVGLLIPRWVRQSNRKAVLLKLLLPSFVLFVTAGLLVPVPEEDQSTSVETEPQAAKVGEEKTATAKATSTPAPKPDQASKPVSNISFKEIRRKMKAMTELQFDEYAKTLVGEKIRWSGYVEDVDQKMFGGYGVRVDMDSPNDPISVQDVDFEMSKEKAMALKKDSRIQFKGTISSVITVLTSLQISLEDVEIIN